MNTLTEIIRCLTEELTGVSSTNEVVWTLSHQVASKLELYDCVVYLLDSEKKALIQTSAYGPKDKGNQTICAPLVLSIDEGGVVGRAARLSQTQLVPDTEADEDYVSDIHPAGSELALPVRFKGRTLGVMDFEHPERNHFNQDIVTIMEAIGIVAAQFLMNAQLLRQLNKLNQQLSWEARRLSENSHILNLRLRLTLSND